MQWWNGPPWLHLPQPEWPIQSVPLPEESEEEKRELCALTIVRRKNLVPYDRFSSFMHLKRITAWILRFVSNCRKKESKITSPLTVSELTSAECY